jgi:hypothetical protein
MVSDDPPTSGLPDSKARRRPAPTIELPAVEIESRPQQTTETEASVPIGEGPEPTDAPSQPSSQRTAGPGFASADGFWRLAGAAVAGGLVVLAGSLLVGTVFRPDGNSPATDTRLTQVEQRIGELANRPASSNTDPRTIENLANRLAKLESAGTGLRASTGDPSLVNRLAATEGEAKALSEIVAILGRRTDETATAARDSRQRADVNSAAIAELKQTIAGLGVSPVGRSEIDALSGRVAAVERSEKALEAALAKRQVEGTTDRSVRFAVAAAALRGAVERGEPFAPLLATTKPLMPDPKALAPLEPFATTGVPLAVTLARQLSELAPALYQAAGSPRDTGLLDRLTASAEKLVRIRPINEVPGTDTSAVIARIEFKAAHADLNGALAELAKLPADVRAPAEAWIKAAQARAAAIATSQRSAADALASLGK